MLGEAAEGTTTDPTMGWSAWLDGGAEADVVPGNHANLVSEPHVEVLAGELTTCRNQARAAEAEQASETGKITR